jgi:hypothetical protein
MERAKPRVHDALLNAMKHDLRRKDPVKYDKRPYKWCNHPSRDIAMQCTAGQRCNIMFIRHKDWRHVATGFDRYPKVFLSDIALATTVDC